MNLFQIVRPRIRKALDCATVATLFFIIVYMALESRPAIMTMFAVEEIAVKENVIRTPNHLVRPGG